MIKIESEVERIDGEAKITLEDGSAIMGEYVFRPDGEIRLTVSSPPPVSENVTLLLGTSKFKGRFLASGRFVE